MTGKRQNRLHVYSCTVFSPFLGGTFCENRQNALESFRQDATLPPVRSISEDLDSLITYHRKAAGLSQVELSSLAGVSRKVVQSLEAGSTKVSWANVLAVLRILNISPEPVGPLVDRWRKEESLKSRH